MVVLFFGALHVFQFTSSILTSSQYIADINLIMDQWVLKVSTNLHHFLDGQFVQEESFICLLVSLKGMLIENRFKESDFDIILGTSDSSDSDDEELEMKPKKKRKEGIVLDNLCLSYLMYKMCKNQLKLIQKNVSYVSKKKLYT